MGISVLVKKSISLPGKYVTELQAKYYAKDRFIILMYHRTLKKNTSETYMHDAMYVDPKVFDMQVKYLKNNFTIGTLEEACKWKNSEKKVDNKKPYCIVTFDDGWKDFYEHAYPILKSNNVSATVFLPTDFIGTSKNFWTESLAKILVAIKRNNIDTNVAGNITNEIAKHIASMDGSIDARIDEAEKLLKTLPNVEINHILSVLAEAFDVDTSLSCDSFLSWEDIKEMHASGVVSFGSHTKTHQILTAVSEEVIREELLQSRNALIEKKVVSSSFIPFSYPNGNFTDRIAGMVKESGYSLAVTTNSGWNKFAESERDLYKLSRAGIHQDMSSSNSMFACRIYGIL